MRTSRHALPTDATGAPAAERRGASGQRGCRTTIALARLAACALAVFAPASALAEDFTVNVPIQLKTMPEAFTRGKVECSAHAAVSGYLIGSGGSNFDVVGGNYTGTVVVKFNADAGRDPGQAASIGCGLWLSTAGSNTWVHPSIIGDGTYIDRTQPFREVSTVQIPKP